MISFSMRIYGWRACLLVALASALAIGLSNPGQTLADSKTDPAGKKLPTASGKHAASRKSSDPVPDAQRQQTAADNFSPEEQKILKALSAPTRTGFVDTQLKDVLSFLRGQHGIVIQLDEAALKNEAIPINIVTNLTVPNISLNSVLNLTLKYRELGFTIEDDALKVTTLRALSKKQLPSALTEFAAQDRGIQQSHADINRALGAKANVDFKKTDVIDVLYFLSQQHSIPMYIVESQTTKANISLRQPVTLTLKNAPAREILTRLLEPLKLKYWVENEVVMIGVQDPDDERLSRIKARKLEADPSANTRLPAGKTPAAVRSDAAKVK